MKLIGGELQEALPSNFSNRRSHRNFTKLSKRNNKYRNSRAKSKRFRKSRAKTERVRQKEIERYSYETRRVKSNTYRKKKSLNKTRHIPEEKKKFKPKKKDLKISRRNVNIFNNLINAATRKLIKPRAPIEVPPRES